MQRNLISGAGLTRIILPQSCVLCGVDLSEGHFCRQCRSELPWIGDACERCGSPLGAPLVAGTHCAGCQTQRPPFDRAIAPLIYAFPADSALKALKFKRQLFFAPALGELLVPQLRRLPTHVDALIPVPLHWRRHAARGFNQAIELCRPLCKQSGLPMIDNVGRVKSTKPQTGLDTAERRRNMKAAFEVRGSLGCQYPVIVDDVITTGETCGTLAKALLRAGAKRVSVITVARAALT